MQQETPIPLPRGFLSTGQTECRGAAGEIISCSHSGQDAEWRRGIPWPEPRFHIERDTVQDRLTGLAWSRDANPADYPMTWPEASEYIAQMNHERQYGHEDWRIPNRRELRSLLCHQSTRPPLPDGHCFTNIFPSWYWTSTTAAASTSHAWYVHFGGGRMFYGGKDQSFMLWPVRGESTLLPVTGQHLCHDRDGRRLVCRGTGQDGEMQMGLVWPRPRFEKVAGMVQDNLTGLCWYADADPAKAALSWPGALQWIAQLGNGWRLPNINELESLTDAAAAFPALPDGHPFEHVRDGYLSSTTSMYEPDWAWALYLDKGAVGVGQKRGTWFHVWPVRDP